MSNHIQKLRDAAIRWYDGPLFSKAVLEAIEELQSQINKLEPSSATSAESKSQTE